MNLDNYENPRDDVFEQKGSITLWKLYQPQGVLLILKERLHFVEKVLFSRRVHVGLKFGKRF